MRNPLRKSRRNICWWCKTEIGGWVPTGKIHIECLFADTSGHLVGCCRCQPPPNGRAEWKNDREMALAAWDRRWILDD